MSDQIRCTDPSATAAHGNDKGRRIGAIVGGAVGGLIIVIAALIMWYLRRKRHDSSSSPPAAQPEAVAIDEPSWFVDNENPWPSMGINGNSQGDHSGLIMGVNDSRSAIVSVPQVCYA